MRKALAEVDPILVLYGVDPHTKVLRGDFQQENMIATLTTFFGVLGLLLAAVGLRASDVSALSEARHAGPS
ncbi:hypothetical protein [Edaphobacter aggregans]|uniref:hypothetical protein n=1 Tax=Edaphobacter aggregans TaxID=570835 RepID=UPI001FE0A2E8|nr:hypothetical protein [Edaphobacter aggregans]